MRPSPFLPAVDACALIVVAAPVLVWLLRRAAVRRSGGAGDADRRGLLFLVAGTVTLGIAFISPLATWARWYLLSAHLVQVTLTMGVAAPFLLLALPRKAGDRTAPGLLRRRRSRALGVAVHPVTALVAVTVVFFAWHTEPLYDIALAAPALYAVEQASLLAVAVMFWWPVIRPLGSGPVLSPMMKLGYVLAAMIPQTFGGITIALAHRVLFRGYGSGPAALGWSPLVDQQVAGACIALLNKVALITAFLVVFLRFMKEEEGMTDDDEGGQHVRVPAEPSPGGPAVPAWYPALTGARLADEPRPRRRRRGRGGLAPGLPSRMLTPPLEPDRQESGAATRDDAVRVRGR